MIEFFKSPSWLGVRSRVLAAFGFSGVGTAANALPQEQMINPYAESLMHIEYLIKIFTLISYGLSVVIAITVLCRFIIWLRDKDKNKNK